MTAKLSQLEDRFFSAVQLTRPLLRHITGAVEAGLRRWNISVGQRAILEALLFHPDSSLPELTEFLQLKRQFIHRILQEAIAAGLADAAPNPSRRGASRYALSAKGKEAILAIRREELGKLRAFLARTDDAEIEAFIRVQAMLNGYFQELAQELPDSGVDTP
jgi:DNA-binding MarR family transcriptional regulator